MDEIKKNSSEKLDEDEILSISMPTPAGLSIDDILSELGFGNFQFNIYLITGFAFFCGGYQIMCYSVLLPLFVIKWQISTLTQCFIISAEHLGYTLGALTVSFLGDKVGRKKPIIYATLIWSIVSLLSLYSEHLILYVFFRFLIGFVEKWTILFSYTLATEYLPLHLRGKLTNLTDVFYGGGNILGVFIGYLLIDFNWRLFILTSTIFTTLYHLWILKFIDESPRYFISTNQLDEAIKIINKIAKSNRNFDNYLSGHKKENFIRSCNKIHMQVTGKYSKTSVVESYMKIFSGKFKIITIILSIFWLGNIVSYFGILNLLPLIMSKLNTIEDSLLLMIAPLGIQIPSCIVSSMIVDVKYIGRKNPLIFSSIIIGISALGIFYQLEPGLLFYLCLILFFHSINFMIKFIFTAELYPTPIRVQGLGFCNFIGRSSGIVMPFIGIYLLEIDYLYPFLFFGMSTLVGGLSLLFIKYDTVNQDLDSMLISPGLSPY